MSYLDFRLLDNDYYTFFIPNKKPDGEFGELLYDLYYKHVNDFMDDWIMTLYKGFVKDELTEIIFQAEDLAERMLDDLGLDRNDGHVIEDHFYKNHYDLVEYIGKMIVKVFEKDVAERLEERIENDDIENLDDKRKEWMRRFIRGA